MLTCDFMKYFCLIEQMKEYNDHNNFVSIIFDIIITIIIIININKNYYHKTNILLRLQSSSVELTQKYI
jgi:hypothetical protein